VGGDEATHRDVVTLDRQRAELHGDQHGDLAGMTHQVVVEPRNTGRARDAAQADERHPLDVGTQPDDRGDPRVQTGHGEPGDRRRDDQVHVGGGQVGGLEGVDDRLRAELHAHLDEPVVRRAEVRQLPVLLQRHREVALLHPGVRMEPAHQAFVEVSLHDHAGERVGDLLLAVPVLGQDPSDRQDLHA
jgi:hypothetical protein